MATRRHAAPVAVAAAVVLASFPGGGTQGSERSCWGSGFSRPACCFTSAQKSCFDAPPAVEGLALRPDDFTHASCCSTPYDQCFHVFIHEALEWNKRTCREYKASGQIWLSKECLTWLLGDSEFESTVATDVLESGLGRCFHVILETNPGPGPLGVGVCTPLPCLETDILLDVSAFVDTHSLLLSWAPFVSHVTAKEMYPWLALRDRADFIIAGFANSGSSTLTHTLASHPEVEVLETRELEMEIPREAQVEEVPQFDWRTWLCSTLLPKSWVEQHLPHPASSPGAKRTVAGRRAKGSGPHCAASRTRSSSTATGASGASPG